MNHAGRWDRTARKHGESTRNYEKKKGNPRGDWKGFGGPQVQTSYAAKDNAQACRQRVNENSGELGRERP